MAWTTPFTAVAGTIITSASWNTSGRDNLKTVRAMLSHIEDFAMEGATSEQVKVYFPEDPASLGTLFLVLRGRLPLAGLVGSHGHGLTGGVSADGIHSHRLHVDDAGGTGKTIDALVGAGSYDDGNGGNPRFIENSVTHTHGNTLGVSANGSGGYTSGQRPSGVTVTIDGTDRTSALGGPFGSSGADWDQEALNIAPYVSGSGWHTILVAAPTTQGRLKVQVLGY